ncbi:MAG: intradiol ring-cleavage dioxygenase [Dehalococcoidia bacterium]
MTTTTIGAAITESVLRSLDQTPDPRLKTIMTSLIRHLHDFVREVELTEAEWMQAIQFLTRVGQMCDDRRQEFILLSDTLGVSMLVDAINHRADGDATESTVLGPFYCEGARELPAGASISLDGEGEPAIVSGRVLSADGMPIAGAVLDVWEGNEDGLYEQQDPDQPDMNLRGRFRTDAEGRYEIVAIKPVSYPVPDDGPVGEMLRSLGRHPYRPAHIHFIVSADGHLPLTTHLFAKGDEYLDSDAVFGTKDSLIVDFIRNDSAEEASRHGVHMPFYMVEYDFVLKPAAVRA